jgi:hypothetical protein
MDMKQLNDDDIQKFKHEIEYTSNLFDKLWDTISKEEFKKILASFEFIQYTIFKRPQ